MTYATVPLHKHFPSRYSLLHISRWLANSAPCGTLYLGNRRFILPRQADQTLCTVRGRILMKPTELKLHNTKDLKGRTMHVIGITIIFDYITTKNNNFKDIHNMPWLAILICPNVLPWNCNFLISKENKLIKNHCFYTHCTKYIFLECCKWFSGFLGHWSEYVDIRKYSSETTLECNICNKQFTVNSSSNSEKNFAMNNLTIQTSIYWLMLNLCKFQLVNFQFLTSKKLFFRFNFYTLEITIHVPCTKNQILNLEIQKYNLVTAVEVTFLNLYLDSDSSPLYRIQSTWIRFWKWI